MQPTIAKLLERLNKEVATLSYGSNPPELYQPIEYIMGLGGKRMRPIMTLLSANLFSDNIEAAYKPALAVEIFHNFTLMHDDIMDKAPLRRGKPTVHEKWSSSVAILSGDVMLVKAYELLAELENDILKESLQAFNKCATEVCEGQQLDMNFESIQSVSEKEYLEMIKLKTAALLGFSLELGGIVTKTTKSNREYLRAFGINMGLGFQLLDDLLDVFGDHEKFGKQQGGDIAANKKTFLAITALQKAKGKDLEVLKKYFQETPAESSKKIKEVTEVYKKLNVKTDTEEKINFYFNQGLQMLAKVDAPLYKKSILKSLAQNMVSRDN